MTLHARLEPLGLGVLVGEGHIELPQRPGVVDPSVLLGDSFDRAAGSALTRGYRQGLLSIGEEGGYHVAEAVCFSLMLEAGQ